MANPTCPVCGMDVSKSQIKGTYKGKEYKFCCPECKKKFEADPEKYV